MNVELKKYRISELMSCVKEHAIGDDILQFGDPDKLEVFAANPFLCREDVVTRVVLFVDGKVAGGEYHYPLEIIADGKVVKCGSGSETSVKEEYRKQGLGLEFLSSEGDPLLSSDIALGCGMAQRYSQIHKMFGFKIFPVYRYIALFKSKTVVQQKICGVIGHIISYVVDCCLGIIWSVFGFMLHMKLICKTVYEVKSIDENHLVAVAKIIELDYHRFRENHSVDWLKWHLDYALHSEGPARLFVVEAHEVIVGFFMIKKKFYEKASSRGFKNVMLGSVIEWGVMPRASISELEVVGAAIQELRKGNVDAVEVATDDKRIGSWAKRHCMVHIGESNFGIRTGGRSPLADIHGWDSAHNWRLRPAMCDNGL